MSKLIPLKRSKEIIAYTVVDDEDYEMLLAIGNWQLHVQGYAVTRKSDDKGKPFTLHMHRVIMDTPAFYEVDHINHDRLDNRKSNLRNCTRQQNMMNVGIRERSKSGIRGVHFRTERLKWHAFIFINGKIINLGHYDDKELAIKARKEAEIEYYGEYATTNEGVLTV